MEGQKEYLAAIAAFPKRNSLFFRKLFGYFPSPKAIWGCGPEALRAAGIEDNAARSFLDHKKATVPERELEKLNKAGVNLITVKADNYPKNLKEIYNPPFFLYIRGEITEKDDLSLAVVGSRKATDYGRRATLEITKEVAASGVTIVSGLAIGLDTEAHKAALSAGARTIAVLANGLDKIYPVQNTALARQIEENGAIISEQPLGMPPFKQHFPARNRIISGISEGVLVTEAGERSGTLYTANFALEQNRQVFAIPGPIYNPLSAGPNSLIKAGAKPVTKGADILEDFGIEARSTEKPRPVGKDEEVIFEILSMGPLHIDEIIRKWGKEPAEVSSTLSLMEIKGKIKHLGGMVYILNS